VTPDVTVLVAAFRRDHPHHAVALAWLEQARKACADGAATLALLQMVVTGFLRLVTHPRVFVQPDAIADLHGNLVTDAWIAAATEALSEHLITFDRGFKRLLSRRDVTVLGNPR
jgi:predicted nucleic acid-binding protein